MRRGKVRGAKPRDSADLRESLPYAHRVDVLVSDYLAMLKLRRIEAETEVKIRDAIQAGEFSGLSGEGAPLRLDGAEAGDRWAALQVMRSAHFVPEWSALRQQIDEERARLVARLRAHLVWVEERRALLQGLPAERILEAASATSERDGAVRRTIAQDVAELNRRIARYNAIVPVLSLQLPPLSTERLRREAQET